MLMQHFSEKVPLSIPAFVRDSAVLQFPEQVRRQWHSDSFSSKILGHKQIGTHKMQHATNKKSFTSHITRWSMLSRWLLNSAVSSQRDKCEVGWMDASSWQRGQSRTCLEKGWKWFLHQECLWDLLQTPFGKWGETRPLHHCLIQLMALNHCLPCPHGHHQSKSAAAAGDDHCHQQLPWSCPTEQHQVNRHLPLHSVSAESVLFVNVTKKWILACTECELQSKAFAWQRFMPNFSKKKFRSEKMPPEKISFDKKNADELAFFLTEADTLVQLQKNAA